MRLFIRAEKRTNVCSLDNAVLALWGRRIGRDLKAARHTTGSVGDIAVGTFKRVYPVWNGTHVCMVRMC